jgi:hypothetical protein
VIRFSIFLPQETVLFSEFVERFRVVSIQLCEIRQVG